MSDDVGYDCNVCADTGYTCDVCSNADGDCDCDNGPELIRCWACDEDDDD